MANREKSKIAATRLTVEEYQALEEIASQKGVSVSMIIYDCLSKLIGGEIKASIGIVTEQILHDRLEHLKQELLEELKRQPSSPSPAVAPQKMTDPHLAQTDSGKRQSSTTSAGNGLSGRALAKRLGCAVGSIQYWRKKGAEVLREETRKRDPDGKVWVFDEESKMYVEESNGV